MAVGNNNQIEKRLWDAADEMRANSKLKSSEYSIQSVEVMVAVGPNMFYTGRELLETLKREKLVLDWQKTQATRAAVRVAVEDKLDELPVVFTREIYTQKCDAIYQHIFESYYGEGRSVYATA